MMLRPPGSALPKGVGEGEKLVWGGPLRHSLFGHQPSPLHLRLPDESPGCHNNCY